MPIVLLYHFKQVPNIHQIAPQTPPESHKYGSVFNRSAYSKSTLKSNHYWHNTDYRWGREKHAMITICISPISWTLKFYATKDTIMKWFNSPKNARNFVLKKVSWRASPTELRSKQWKNLVSNHQKRLRNIVKNSGTKILHSQGKEVRH